MCKKILEFSSEARVSFIELLEKYQTVLMRFDLTSNLNKEIIPISTGCTAQGVYETNVNEIFC